MRNCFNSQELQVGDRVEIVAPAGWGKGTVAEVHRINGRVVM